MALIADIQAFFQLVAQHPLIGHAPGATPPVNRFYGYNFEEFETNTKDNPGFFPCLGLSDSPHSGLQGSYSSGAEETSVTNMMGVNVLILDQVEQGNYNAEYELYDRLLPVFRDLVRWIQWKVAQGPLTEYQFLDTLDMTTINVVRVGPKGAARAYGWKLSIAFKHRSVNSNTNPLNTILN